MSFIDQLVAAERAMLDRAFGSAQTVRRPAREHGPLAYGQQPVRPRGPIGKYWPPNYRQPIVPLTQPGALRRYEFFATPVAATTLPAVVVPVGTVWRIISVKCQFNTDATAGNRAVGLVILPDSGTIAQGGLTAIMQSSLLMQPSQAANHTWLSGGGYGAFITTVTTLATIGTGGLPEKLVLTENARLQFISQNSLAGDSFSLVEVHVEEWITVTR